MLQKVDLKENWRGGSEISGKTSSIDISGKSYVDCEDERESQAWRFHDTDE